MLGLELMYEGAPLTLEPKLAYIARKEVGLRGAGTREDVGGGGGAGAGAGASSLAATTQRHRLITLR